MDKSKPSGDVFINEDGVLTKILSKLSLKDAVKTSVLSRRWRYIWTYMPNIHVFCPNHHNFCSDKIFRIGREQLNDLLPKLTDETVQIMDIVLKQHCGSGVETFRVGMPFYEKHVGSLDQWVAFAAAANTKELLMAFQSMENKFYDFPFHLLFQQNRHSSIKSLHLQSCSLQVPAGIGCLRSLQTLKICYVTISDVDLQNLVSTCAVMEELDVSVCHDLVNMSIHQQSGRLKHLTVYHCLSLMSIDVQTEKLVSFWYRGKIINFSFPFVSCITEGEVSFKFDARVLNFVLMKLPNILPQFQKLKLAFEYVPELTHMPEMSCHRFEHLKDLAVFVNFENGGNALLLIALLTRAPRLEKLSLNLHPIAPDMHMDVPVHNIPLAYLKEVEITGFIGSEWQIKFLQYLFNNASTLRSMKISVLLVTKYYQQCCQWFLHSRDGTTSDYIKSLAPPDLDIDISYVTSPNLVTRRHFS